MIFYFSGTGNSKYVARKIGNEIGGEIINMADDLKGNNLEYNLQNEEYIGFVFPVYCYGIPTIVSDFAKNMKINLDDNDPYVFVVITCGGSIANASGMFNNIILESNGLFPYAVYSHLMPDNYIPMYNVPSVEESKDRLEKGNDILFNDIIPTIKSKEIHPLNPSKFDVLQTKIMYPTYVLLRNTKSFYATEDCTSCGLCERVCPVDAIELIDGEPVWTKKKCTKCLACIHRCPVRAIQHGKGTVKRNRYAHPEINIEVK